MDPSYGIAILYLAAGATAFHQTSSRFVVFFNIEEFFYSILAVISQSFPSQFLLLLQS